MHLPTSTRLRLRKRVLAYREVEQVEGAYRSWMLTVVGDVEVTKPGHAGTTALNL